MVRNSLALFVAACGVGIVAAPAAAGPVYTFTRITANGAQDVAPQLSVEVEPAGPGQVDFIFRNAGPLASSIADVYFDDGTLLGIAQIFSGSGVVFGPGASPANLPGGNAIDFNASADFSAQAASPVQPSGVNPGEMLTIRFNLIGGQSFGDTIDAIELSLANPGVDVFGGLRIGIHVQGLPDGQSDGFVNGPMIPLPTTGAMAGVALAGLAGRRRRRAGRAVPRILRMKLLDVTGQKDILTESMLPPNKLIP